MAFAWSKHPRSYQGNMGEKVLTLFNALYTAECNQTLRPSMRMPGANSHPYVIPDCKMAVQKKIAVRSGLTFLCKGVLDQIHVKFTLWKHNSSMLKT